MYLDGVKGYVASLWLLSAAIPLGMMVGGAPAAAWLWFFTAGIFLDTGHAVSPIVMAWAHAGFRQIMLRRPWKFIALPLAIIALAGSVGAITSAGWTTFVWASYRSKVITDFGNPYPLLVWVYILWNFYHFGMQNFGITSLLRTRAKGSIGKFQRACDMSWCVGLTTFGLVTYAPIIAFNHWMVEIGLCGKVMKGWRRWAFLVAVPVLGSVALKWTGTVTPHGVIAMLIPWMISLRLGLGMAHFLYSKWVWTLSDAQVRATIGLGLGFRPENAPKPLGVLLTRKVLHRYQLGHKVVG